MDGRFGIMAPLHAVEVGGEYESGQSPLHVTLLGNFRIGYGASELMGMIREAHPDSPIRVDATSRAMFGPDTDTPVTVLAESQELRELHETLVALLVGAGGVLDDPEFAGGGYRAHVSDGVGGSIRIGEVVTLRSLAVIDLNPGGHADRRRFVGVTPFARS